MLTTVVLPGPPASGAAGEDLCARFGPVEETGTVADASLTEISGLARSDAHPGVLWTHNDSGDDPRLFAMTEEGASLGVYPVEGAEAVDWEDLAAGPGPEAGTSYLYVADIGDNPEERPAVTVYRVPEPTQRPAGADDTLRVEAAIALRYPSGPVDAEALLVDPRTGDLVVVTKSFAGTAGVLRAPAASLVDGGTTTLEEVGEITPGPFAAVTGGDVSPDGSLVLIRTYTSVLAFPRADGDSVAEALLGEPCGAPQGREHQGETVAVTAAGDAYLTVSEGEHQPLHRVAIGRPGDTSSTTATTPTTTPTAAAPPANGAADDRARAVAVAVAVVVLAAAVLAWRRRPR